MLRLVNVPESTAEGACTSLTSLSTSTEEQVMWHTGRTVRSILSLTAEIALYLPMKIKRRLPSTANTRTRAILGVAVAAARLCSPSKHPALSVHSSSNDCQWVRHYHPQSCSWGTTGVRHLPVSNFGCHGRRGMAVWITIICAIWVVGS